MANRSVLPEMLSQVQTFFSDESINTAVYLGFKAAGRQDNQGPGGANRIVFDLRGAKEKVLPPKGGTTRQMQDGTRSRCLCTIQWSIPVQFWAADRGTPGDPENDIAQLEAYVTMFERCTAAVHSYLHGSYQWADGVPVPEPTERVFGRAWTKTLLVLEDIYDVEFGVATPGNLSIGRSFEASSG